MKLVDEDGNKVKNQYAHLNLLEALESQIKVKVRLDVRFTEILENTFNNNHTQLFMIFIHYIFRLKASQSTEQS